MGDLATTGVLLIVFLLASLLVGRLVGSARKQAKALRRSEANLAEAQRLSHTGSFDWRVASGEILWSDETFRIFQYDRATKPTLERVLQRVHPEDAALVNQAIERASRGEGDFDLEHRLLMADGSIKHLRVVGHGVGVGDGIKFFGAVMDVTTAKVAQERIRQNERELRIAIETRESQLHEAQRLGHMGSSVTNFSTGACSASPELLRILGFDPDKGQPTLEMLRERVHPDDLGYLVEIVEKARGEKSDYEVDYRVVLPDGSTKHCHTVARPLFDGSGEVAEYFSTTLDVTERMRAEEVLERSQNRFRAMVERSDEGIVLMRPYHKLIYASPSVERVLGYTPQELAGLTLKDLLPPDHALHSLDSRAQMQLEPDREATTEVMARHKDGSFRWIESTTRNLLHEPSVQAVVVNFRDVTERKLAQAERERLEMRLRQAEKMEAVGRLAGGIAHDFNNVLGGIFAYGEMLFDKAPERSPLKRYAQNVLTAATRGRELVEQILAYSRSQRGKRAPVDVAHVVAETLELVRGSLPAGIRLEASAPETALVVIGDATQLHQVLMNLCSNAIQAVGAGGTVRVALEAAVPTAELGLSHGTLRPGRYVRLSVEDSGSGMDEATLSRIFEPFFTTKEIGRGTGLGLSLVYAIVTDSGGAIDVKTAPGQGSTFTIYLALADVVLTSPDETAAPAPRGNGERVLLVEDEAPLLAGTAEVLSQLGYEPVPFSDSHAALAAFEAAPGRFDLVLTDEVMPGLTGTGLASVVRRHRPDLPIVLVSGYSGPLLTQQALAAGISELLTKPLQSREIAATLARALHRTG